MKKIFVLIVAIIGFFSMANAQECHIHLTVIECESSQNVPTAVVTIQLFSDPNCYTQVGEDNVFKSLNLPIQNQMFKLNPTDCSLATKMTITFKFFNDNGDVVCEGALNCVDFTSGEIYTVYP